MIRYTGKRMKTMEKSGTMADPSRANGQVSTLIKTTEKTDEC